MPVLTIAFVVLGGFIGLYFTPLSWVSTFGVPVAAGVVATSLFGLIALPFFPWLLAALVVLLVYETIHQGWLSKLFGMFQPTVRLNHA